MIANVEEYSLSLVDASIHDLQHALSTGSVTSVELVTAYLYRISAYDCRGPSLNSIPLLNQAVFEEAAASDDRRVNGRPLGPLDGIPFTVKDSYKVKGMTVASGSAAFQDLVASEDAFTVHQLRQAGAVLIGKTNMCPMAAGGMQRGVYGRAENPYNLDYLAAAFASGSSNGSGVSTGASFAAFGMGEETVSSGRSPASNNALVAYTPSRGAISIRGNWPLYPTCDVVVPHTRSVDDLLTLLDVITAQDEIKQGDFWRDQPYVRLDTPWGTRPSSFQDLAPGASLRGIRVAVPSMYIGGKQITDGVPVHTCPEVLALYQQAKSDLEALGATVVEVNEFPVVEHYERANSGMPAVSAEQLQLPKNWHTTERSVMIAHAWQQFLHENDDINLNSLHQLDHSDIYPTYPADDPHIRYSEPTNRIHYEKLQSLVAPTSSDSKSDNEYSPRSALMSISGLEDAVVTLESMRKAWFDDWLDANSFDCVMFPACGDVGKADADVDYISAEYAWRNGIRYSNGNRALRHLGIPSMTLPMGLMKDKHMPVGLTFLGRAYDDLRLLEWACAFEKATRRRTAPPVAPEMGTGKDQLTVQALSPGTKRKERPDLQVEKCRAFTTVGDTTKITVEGFIACSRGDHMEKPTIEIIVDGRSVDAGEVTSRQCHGTMCGRAVYDFRCSVIMPSPPVPNDRNRVASRKKIARDSIMVVIVAKEGENGRPSGLLRLL